MNRDLVIRYTRRAIVLAATVAVLGVGVMTVQAAAEWRAASAPLDEAPVGMTTVNDDYAAEVDRATELSGQVDSVAGELAALKAAVVTANGSMTTDTESATVLQAQLDTAKTKLEALQKQLKKGEARLAALNRAAARQAALNRAAAARQPAKSATSAPAKSSGGGEHEDDDD
jgi:septal ring factor EnvC (AmiA/AmiB activator)